MSKPNGFEKYLGKEDVMQAEVVRVLSNKYPALMWWHTPNEGKRTPFEQYKFKELGGKKGVADFVILEEANFSKGLMIEIKFGRNGCSKDQVEFLIQAAQKGYTAAVVYDYAQDVIALVEQHLKSGLIFPMDGILLVKGGAQTVVPFADAQKVLCKKSSEATQKKAVQKMFREQAEKKFGPIKSSLKSAWADKKLKS